MEMVRLATGDNPSFEPSEIEINRGGRSYTIDTVEALAAVVFPDTELYFITGLDSFLEIQTWHDWKRLLTLCNFVVISRPGYHFADLAKISFMKNAAHELDRAGPGRSASRRWSGPAHSRIYLETIPLFDISSTDIRKQGESGRKHQISLA